MSYKFLAIISALSLPVISSCTPAQINSAIEACKGEPACYEIIDDAIKDELEARGITGGKMTNIEYNQVKIFLQTFIVGPGQHQFSYYKWTEITNKSYYLDGGISNHNLVSNVGSVANEFNGLTEHRVIPSADFLDLDLVNPDTKQLFYTGTNFDRAKHLIFKIGANRFSYEIYASQSYVFSIDLDLSSLFLNEKRYISPQSIYEYFNENYPWENIFSINPLLIDNQSTFLEIEFQSTDDGFYLNQHGHYYYMKENPTYSSELPLFSLLYFSSSSQRFFGFSSGYSGSFEDFNPGLNLWVSDYSENIIDPTKTTSFSVELPSDMLDRSFSLSEWIDFLIKHPDLITQNKGFSIPEVQNLIMETFSGFLERQYTLGSPRKV
jgi:hypothetical protein